MHLELSKDWSDSDGVNKEDDGIDLGCMQLAWEMERIESDHIVEYTDGACRDGQDARLRWA
eukprot:7413806-Karenia_brevis.AAC.1